MIAAHLLRFGRKMNLINSALMPSPTAYLIRGAVLEGCSAAGKTSVLKALKRRLAELELERSIVILSEHYSQALQKIGGEYRLLTPDEHRSLLDERLHALESLQQWGLVLGSASIQSRGVFFVLERFHLNHRIAYAQLSEATEQEARLKKLHAVCFLLTVSESHVAQRLTVRLRASGRSCDPQAVAAASDEFMIEQAKFVQAAERSSLSTIVINTDDQNWQRCADLILEHLSTEPNKALEPTRLLVTDRAPSSTLRAK